MSSFPIEAKSFANSLAGRLLDRFSLFLEFLSYPLPSDRPPKLLEKRHAVERAQKVLCLLAGHSFDAQGLDASRPGAKGVKQKKRKQSRNCTPKTVMDTKAFDELGMTVPTDQDEAFAVVASIIDEQKRLMEVGYHGSYYVHLIDAVMHSALSTSLALCTSGRHDTTCLRVCLSIR